MSIESRSRQYGKVFDHWQIKEFLGSGSGGKTAVFRLVRSDSGWGVSALKVINLIEERGDIETLSDYRKREYEYAREECSKNAEQEVRLMDDLRGNTNIVDYLDHTFVDWSDDSGFGRDLLIRMELLKDLRSEIRSGKIFTEREVLKIGRDICIALIRCHRKNILHRDVKPENIFRNKDGDYKLGDFGVSRVLDACPGAVASTGIGTYEYWPAEQMTGRYDKRVDIYSLGLVLYELCNQNHLPFASSTYATSKEVSMRLAGTPLPAPINASISLAKVILKACAFDPNERYQTAEELLKALNHVIRGSQTVTEQKTAKPTQRKAQPKEAYNTIPAEPTADKASASYYATIPASSDEQSVDQPFSTEPVRKKSYATEPTEKHSPRYVTQKVDYNPKRRVPVFWIVVALLGLCIAIFSAGLLFMNGSDKQPPDKKENILQSEIAEETVNTMVASTAEYTEINLNKSESTSTPTEVIETTSPVVETTEPVYMQTIRVKTASSRNYYGTPQRGVSGYDENGYLIHAITNSNDKTLCFETYYIYNDMVLMDEVAAICDEGSTFSDSERRTRKDALYGLLKSTIGYTGSAYPSFCLVCTDQNGYVVQRVNIHYYDDQDDPIDIIDRYVTYDDKMNKILDISYRDGKKYMMCEYAYDKNNRVISRYDATINADGSENPQYEYEYFYDNMGRCIQESVTCLFNSVHSWYTTYTYNENGTLYTEEMHSGNGIVRITVNKLDEYGNIVATTQSVAGIQDYANYITYENIFVPSNQVEALCNTYDGVGVSYSIVEENE